MFVDVPAYCSLGDNRGACRAPVAQMDRALASGAKGRGFESLLARHLFLLVQLVPGRRTRFLLLLLRGEGCCAFRISAPDHIATSRHSTPPALRSRFRLSW